MNSSTKYPNILNEGQQHLFNFIMKYALNCKLAKKNNQLAPKPFQIFLSGGAGIECLKWVLRYPNQKLDQPSIPMTASTWKDVRGFNSITLHSAFHLTFKSGLKSYQSKKPSTETSYVEKQKHILKNPNAISFTSQDIGQYAYYDCLLGRMWCHKIWN